MNDIKYPVLPQPVYEVLRWVVCIVLPAAIALYGLIGLTCNIPHTDIVLTIAGGVETFLGTIFGFDKIMYDRRQNA
jgi:hypothetical protein